MISALTAIDAVGAPYAITASITEFTDCEAFIA
jgi:hypothetical protein